MIPVPNLDDRSWEDLVDEAIRLIPKYCPEWTNHNPSDPGITLIELFAWLMEMSIYRLNKVTEKNFLAFLDLMGIDLQPPQPARALLTFGIAHGAKNFQIVPVNTTVATEGKGDEPPLIFETIRDLVVIPNQLQKCYSQFHDTFDDCTDRIQGRLGRDFEAFMGCRRIDRFLYLSDPNFETISDEALLIVGFSLPESPNSNFPVLCDWEFWNGHRWRDLSLTSMELPHNYIAFEGNNEFDICEIDGHEGYWVRGRLVEVPQYEESTIVDKIFTRVEILGDGVLPEEIGTLLPSGTYIPIDTTKNFFPFQKNPEIDSIFLLSNPELFGHGEAHIRIVCELADNGVASEAPNASTKLKLSWEFFDGKRWQSFGISSSKGSEDSLAGVNFEDATHAFTQSGTISFNIPKEMKSIDIQGHDDPWIRIRIIEGDYGVQGTYILEGDRWVWNDERPLRPPILKDLSLKYADKNRIPKKILTFNDFRFSDISDEVQSDLRHTQIFEPIPEESPSIYLGFDKPFPNESIQIFIHVVEKTNLDLIQDKSKHLKKYYKKMEEMYYGDKRLVWEYWNGDQWYDLGVFDKTRAFTESGFIEFLGPKDMSPTRKFGDLLFWMRCRLEMGGYEQLPRIDHILLNTIEADHRTTLKFEILGGGKGTPNESLSFMNTPVLEGEEVWVREREEPLSENLNDLQQRLGKDTRIIKPDPGGRGEFWIRWAPVDSFYASGARCRHYTIDRLSGKVQFGDGRRGMLVPKGDQNIRTNLYRVGGGSKGNVGQHKINRLRQSIALIHEVTNHYPAQGGSDIESIEQLKQRGPFVIKSRYRAVTKEDFEWLTMQASNSIARSQCLPSLEKEGEVLVLIVPKFNEDNPNYREKLLPSTELLRRVTAYLDERRLVTVKVNVERPSYREISVVLDVIRSPRGVGERLKAGLDKALRKFLHPIHGGRDGKGWEFGRNVLKVDLYHVAEEVPGVDYVEQIQIYDEDRNLHIEQMKLSAKELPYLVNLEINEKARERIL